MIPIKICGITNTEDALLAAELGAAAIGFIFHQASPRFVDPTQVRTIILKIGRSIRKVGVFVNTPSEEINRTVAETGLDMVQLSGEETPESCLEVAVPVIKALHIGSDFNPAMVAPYEVHALLLDTHQPGRYGGTGRTFDWSQFNSGIFSQPIILSGGLTPENVVEGIQAVQPSAADVNSGIEVRPGVKDRVKMKQLFAVLDKIEGSGGQVF
jgi:phosphoribosylanthranilate isomerase